LRPTMELTMRQKYWVIFISNSLIVIFVYNYLCHIYQLSFQCCGSPSSYQIQLISLIPNRFYKFSESQKVIYFLLFGSVLQEFNQYPVICTFSAFQ
jgi:hypothetical protein